MRAVWSGEELSGYDRRRRANSGELHSVSEWIGYMLNRSRILARDLFTARHTTYTSDVLIDERYLVAFLAEQLPPRTVHVYPLSLRILFLSLSGPRGSLYGDLSRDQIIRHVGNPELTFLFHPDEHHQRQPGDVFYPGRLVGEPKQPWGLFAATMKRQPVQDLTDRSLP